MTTRPATDCPVHNPGPCCEGPCEHEVWGEPTEADLVAELAAHLRGDCPAGGCGYCYEEWEVRTYGQETVDARDAAQAAAYADDCTCDDEDRVEARLAAHESYLDSLVCGSY